MSFKPEFKLGNKWCGNAQCFATREEARESASARFSVWTTPSDFRASESIDSVNYKRVDGQDVHVTDWRVD